MSYRRLMLTYCLVIFIVNSPNKHHIVIQCMCHCVRVKCCIRSCIRSTDHRAPSPSSVVFRCMCLGMVNTKNKVLLLRASFGSWSVLLIQPDETEYYTCIVLPNNLYSYSCVLITQNCKAC